MAGRSFVGRRRGARARSPPGAPRGAGRWVEWDRARPALLGLTGDGRVPACGYVVGVPPVALVPGGETEGGGPPPGLVSWVALGAAVASAAAISEGRMRGPHIDGR